MRRYEFYDELIARGVTSENIRIRQSVDKWNPEDDGETEEYLGRINHKIGSAEEFAYDIIERIGVQKYRNTVKSMEYDIGGASYYLCTGWKYEISRTLI